MKYIVLVSDEDVRLSKAFKTKDKAEKPEVEMGDVIIVPDTEKKVSVIEIGDEDVTAQDEEGNKYVIKKDQVKTEEEYEEENDPEKIQLEREQREKIKISLDDLLNKRDKKSVDGLDEPSKGKKEKEDENTVENYLKKNVKPNGWVQTSVVAKEMEISLSEADKQLQNLKELGQLQVVAEGSDTLYKYRDGRIETEARPNTYKKDQFDRLKKKPEEDEEKPKVNVKKLKPSDIWKEKI